MRQLDPIFVTARTPGAGRGTPLEARTFTIAHWRWLLPLLILVGAGPATARIAIERDVLRVRMGRFWFRATVPLRSIVLARRSANAWFSVGIHTTGMQGWIVNGSPLGMVHLTIEPPAAGRFVGLPIKVSNHWLSFEEPDAFLAALSAAGSPAD